MQNYRSNPLLFLVCALITIGILALLLHAGLHRVAENSLVPPEGTEQEYILGLLTQYYWIMAGVIAMIVVLWILLAGYLWKVVDPERDSGKRMVWGFLWFIALLAGVISALLLLQSAEGGTFAVLLGLTVAALLLFWIPTLLFTPHAFKYAPIGAVKAPHFF